VKAKSNERLEKPEGQDFIKTEIKAGLFKCS